MCGIAALRNDYYIHFALQYLSAGRPMQHYASCCYCCQDFPESPAWHAVLVRPGLSDAQERIYLHAKTSALARRAVQTRLKLQRGSPETTHTPIKV